MSVSSVAALALSVAVLASISGPTPASAAPASVYDQRQNGEYNARVRFGHYILLLIPVSVEEAVAPFVYDPFDFPKRTLPKKYHYKPEEKAGHESVLGDSIGSPVVAVPVPKVSEVKSSGHKVPSALTKLHPVVQDISSDVLVALSPSVALAKTQPLKNENTSVIAEEKSDFVKEIFVPVEEIVASDAVKTPSAKIPSLADKFVKEMYINEDVPVIDFIVPAAPVAIVKNKSSPLGNKIDQSIFSPSTATKETVKTEPVAVNKPVAEIEDIAHDITLEQIKKAKSISATLTILPKEPPNEPEVAQNAEEAAFRERERILEKVTAGIEICSPDQVRDEEGNCTSIKSKRRSESLPLEGNVALVSGLSFGLSPASE